MQVKEVMSRRIIAISPEETVAVAARLLSQHNIGALPVCSRDGRLRGMVTDRDIVVRCVAAGDDPERTRVAEIMTRRVLAAEPDRSVDGGRGGVEFQVELFMRSDRDRQKSAPGILL